MDIQKRTRRNEKWRTLADRIRKSIPKSPLAAMANLFSSFLLSRGVLLGAIAPFGLSASAAHHTGRFMLWRLLGAIAGYISVSGKINSLKYIACIILIFTAHFVFDGTSLSKKRGFVLLSAVIPTACINFVFLADSGFSLFDTAMYFLEIALVGLFAVSFSFIIKEGGSTKPEISFGLLSLSVGIISALCDVTIGGISLGRCLSLLFLLFCAFGGGVTGGAVCGTVFGFSLSLSLSCPEYALIYGTLGILSSLFSSFGKYIFAAVGLLCFLPLTVILGQSTNPAPTFEFLIAASLFLPFAEKVSFRMRTLFASSHKKSDLHTKRYVSERLYFAANAFGNLGAAFSPQQQKKTKTLTDIRELFEKNSRALCTKCSLFPVCWNRDFESTNDAFRRAGEAILLNGILSLRDFPVHFSSRCTQTETFINNVNREIFAMRYQKRFDDEFSEKCEILKRQYCEASQVFSSIASDISENTHFDEEAETEISDLLTRNGVSCDVAVYRDNLRHINIHLYGHDLSKVLDEYPKLEQEFCKFCKTLLSPPQYSRENGVCDIVIRERPRIRGDFGAAFASRNSAEKSGDSGVVFYPAPGKLALLISDGMGSGKSAAEESEQCISLVSDLLKAGLAPKNALITLEASLSVRAKATNTFATLDLLYVDLFTGYTEIFKFAGAPSYIKRGNKIRRITTSSLPLGMGLGKVALPDQSSFTLMPGDVVIMASDGIAEGNDDEIMLSFLSEADVTSPKALADEVLAFSAATFGKSDDMTVAVLKIESEY